MAIMAVLAMASCSKNEIIDANYEAISFGGAFVNNATKATDPSYGAKPLTAFNVYATVTGNAGGAVVYSGEEVTGTVGESSIWECKTKTQYWIPDADYSFVALVDVPVADVTLVDNLPSSFTYDVSTQKDVLHATATATGKLTGNDPVSMTFNHLLAKAFFTFTNTDASANLTVTDIQISGLRKNGTYTVGATTPWATDDADYTQDFGGAVVAVGKSATNENERMILPGTYTIIVTFKIVDDKGGQSQDISATIANQTFDAAHVYNFTADIKSGLKYIEFTINPSDWESGSDNVIQG